MPRGATSFASEIGASSGQVQLRPDGRDADDPSAVTHVPKRLLEAEERSHDVDGMNALEFFPGDLREWFEQGLAGIGDEYVESREGLDGLAKQPSHLVALRDVGRDGSRRATPPDDRLDDVERLGRALRVVHHDRCTLAGETFGGRSADAS